MTVDKITREHIAKLRTDDLQRMLKAVLGAMKQERRFVRDVRAELKFRKKQKGTTKKIGNAITSRKGNATLN
jgi:hypothetical protein